MQNTSDKTTTTKFLTTRKTSNLLEDVSEVLTVLRAPRGRYPQTIITVIAKDYTPYPGDSFQYNGCHYRIVPDP